MNKNIIWEDKGIILGIIKYIMKHNDELLGTDIIVESKKFRYILISLFREHSFKKRGNGFHVSIRSGGHDGLVINNLKSIDKLRTKKVTLLPWYDEDNPLIMFVADGSSDRTVINTMKKIDRFKQHRFKAWSDRPTYIDLICGIQIWDTYIEYQILKKYCKYYNQDVRNVHSFICKALENPCCTSVQLKPVYVPRYIAVPNGMPNGDKDESCKELLSTATRKINLVNDLMSSDLQK
jgi:hypothetical protein